MNNKLKGPVLTMDLVKEAIVGIDEACKKDEVGIYFQCAKCKAKGWARGDHAHALLIATPEGTKMVCDSCRFEGNQ